MDIFGVFDEFASNDKSSKPIPNNRFSRLLGKKREKSKTAKKVKKAKLEKIESEIISIADNSDGNEVTIDDDVSLKDDSVTVEDNEVSVKDDEESVKDDEESVKDDEESVKDDEESVKDDEESVKDDEVSMEDDVVIVNEKVTKHDGVSVKDFEMTVKDDELNKEIKAKLEQVKTDLLSPSHSIQSIKIHVIEAVDTCLHEVALPPDWEFTPLVRPKTLLKEYPFLLDAFQKEALICVENDESVLVSAHTSSGKTVVGEYSILKSLKNKQRVIYTTPIKALSNQKYREFQEEFGDVGLITGDVTINPDAGCLIMTTEILRNMLYRGNVIIKEVSWVIFDEIHYMRDKSRGVVWEETLILLPDNVHFVFLSATIPNAKQFAEWVAHIHNQPCHVVYTEHRPTPLQHYLFPVGGDSLHLIIDEKGKFNDRNFEMAMDVVSHPKQPIYEKRNRGPEKAGTEMSCLQIVRMLMEKNLAPAIIFSFSKKDCEIYAMEISKVDFNTAQEKNLVNEIFMNAIEVLSEEDKQLPQVQNLVPLLKRGIGIHHGGLLPILKETIEILFAEGLIKALFATETFAMGLNMPARTVVFTNTMKYDGKASRCITSGEYIQMSGRAGRRGLDDKGTVIVMTKEPLSLSRGKALFQGKADALNSAFHLTYNMILNLIRVDDINPEYLLDRSFFQFQNHANIPILQKKLVDVNQNLEQLLVEHVESLTSYNKLIDEKEELTTEFLTYIHNPKHIQPFLKPGRLVSVRDTKREKDIGWTMLLSFKRVVNKNSNPLRETPTFTIDVLAPVDQTTAQTETPLKPDSIEGKLSIVRMPLTNIRELSSVCVVLPNDLRIKENMTTAKAAFMEVEVLFEGKLPILDPIKNMRIQDDRFEELYNQINNLTKRLENHEAQKFENFEDLQTKFLERKKLLKSKSEIILEIEKSLSLLQMDELKCRKRVLRRLEFCNEADVIDLKGRVACEISSADELLLTEMLLSGMFNSLSSPEVAALLSCFVCEEKMSNKSEVPETLMDPLRKIKVLGTRIATVCLEARIEMDMKAYLEKVNPSLAKVVLAWCTGQPFIEICKMTDTFEGCIIRTLRRLEELLRQFIQAAKTLGNTDLEVKFQESIRLLKRDIVFAASLYL